MRPATAKILFHSDGLGTPNVDLVRQRADEIALINGRKEHTEADWQQAKYEIHGTHHVDDEPAEELGATAMVSGHDMLAADVGHHLPKLGMEDDGNVVEELIREGMEEAEHEQMLESCREQNLQAADDEKED